MKEYTSTTESGDRSWITFTPIDHHCVELGVWMLPSTAVGPRRVPKGKIKPPRRHNQPEVDTWPRLANAIQEVQNKNASKLRFEEQYRYAYTLIIHKRGAELYQGVQNLVAEHLNAQVKHRIVPFFPQTATPANSSSIITTTTSSSNVSTSASTLQLDSSASSRLGQVQSCERLLQAMKDVWDDHVACMSKLRDILQYMDKVYIKPPLLPTFSLGLSLFLSTVIENPEYPVKKYILSSLLDLVHLERQSETINRSSIFSSTDMLAGLRPNDSTNQMSIYQQDFEPLFLSQTTTFYKIESDDLITNASASEYLLKIEKRLQEEESRVYHYLQPSTGSVLIPLLETILIADQTQAIIKHPRGGLNNMITESNFDELTRLYTLFERTQNSISELRKGVYDWIVNAGDNLNEEDLGGNNASLQLPKQPLSFTKDDGKDIKQEEDSSEKQQQQHQPPPSQKEQQKQRNVQATSQPSGAVATQMAVDWVAKILQLKAKLDEILKRCFQMNRTLDTGIVEAFADVMNKNKRAPEFISLFLDDSLRKGFKGKTEEEIEGILSQAVTLFRLLSDKDVFERYYKTHLAKRLLQGRSASDDAERSILSKFKIESGASFVRDLEGMLRDVKLSQDMTSEFRKAVAKNNLDPSIEISAQVCTSSFWPMSSKDINQCKLPPIFTKAANTFERFYLGRHSGRKLSWKPEFGNVDVKIAFDKRVHEVNVSTYGMVVLSMFENLESDEKLSYEDIVAGTGIPTVDLNRTLQSLACAKYRILTKEPKGRDINETDTFMFNSSFTCPLAKIKIQTVANKVETQAERDDTNKKTDEERKLLIEACVVRIMKNRKSLLHNELVNEVVIHMTSRFRPSLPHIKHAIDRLIENDYLERDSVDRKKLHYLA